MTIATTKIVAVAVSTEPSLRRFRSLDPRKRGPYTIGSTAKWTPVKRADDRYVDSALNG